MAGREQVKPLAPASRRTRSDIDLSTELNKHPHRKSVGCCGCAVALILIQAVVILVLIFTVFRVKDPILKMNSVKLDGNLNLASLTPGTNLTVVADVSVKNPNAASFKYGNTTTTIYYGGAAVGEGRNPPGVAKAGRTIRINMTIEIMLDMILGASRFKSDLNLGTLPISSYTSIAGKVKILKIVKKNVVVRMNCTMAVNVTSQAIQDQNCLRSVSLR